MLYLFGDHDGVEEVGISFGASDKITEEQNCAGELGGGLFLDSNLFTQLYCAP